MITIDFTIDSFYHWFSMILPLHRATEAVPWEGTALRWWVLDALPSGDACDASPGPRPRNHLAPLVFSTARNYGNIWHIHILYIYIIWFKISNFQKIHENTVYPIVYHSSIVDGICEYMIYIYVYIEYILEYILYKYIYTHMMDIWMEIWIW